MGVSNTKVAIICATLAVIIIAVVTASAMTNLRRDPFDRAQQRCASLASKTMPRVNEAYVMECFKSLGEVQR